MRSERKNSETDSEEYGNASIAWVLLLLASLWGQGMTQGIMSPPANVRPPGLNMWGLSSD